MGVNYRYPGTLLIGGILIVLVCLIAWTMKKRHRRQAGIRVANTNRLKAHPLYRRKLFEARIFRVLTMTGILLSLIAALFLTARPYREEMKKDTVSRRDIFLCIDLSSSNYAGVKDLVEEFARTVEGLDGDRIGISVFNTSSMRYVPMTDDYDFVQERLKELAEYLEAEQEFTDSYVSRYDSVYDIPESERGRYEELNRILASFDQGITAGYEVKGTSAVGEGLASCLFSFPELTKEDRTRVILFLTDNKEELLDEPLATLEEAAQMCRSDKVTVFGIYPGSGNTAQGDQGEKDGSNAGSGAGSQADAAGSQDQTDSAANTEGAGFTEGAGSADEKARMKAAVELTGGSFYESGSSITAEDILADIASREKQNTKTRTASIDTDTPFFWFCVLIGGFVLLAATTAFFVLRRGIRRGQLSRKLTAAVLLAAMAASLVVIGIRPMYLSPSAEIMTGNLDVAFVVDTTISMWAQDHGSGTRMEGVKKDIHAIMNALPGSSFSLIRFDNGAEILTPFTQDIEAVSDMVDELGPPAYSTARGSSLNTAYEALDATLQSAGRKAGNRRTVVFVFSDGETTDGSKLRSFQELQSLISEGAVLGYGTKDGGRMDYPGRGFIKNNSTGEYALSRMDEESLQQMADDLDLTYIDATDDYFSHKGLKGSSLGTRLYSIRLLSKNVAFSDGDREGYEDTYFYFSAFAEFLLLIWLYLTIYRGGVA